MNRLWLLWVLSLIPITIWSQEKTEFTVEAPKVVLAGESFQVRYILKNPKSQNPKLYAQTDINGLEYYGKSQYYSSQSNIVIINGKLKSVTTHTITWILTFLATKPGTYTIPPAKVVDQGQTLVSNPVTITVESGAVNQLPKPKYQRQQPATDEQDILPATNKSLFLRLVANKTNVYQGEAIYVYVRLYSRYHLSVDDMTPGKYSGFWVQDLPMPSRIQGEDVYLNGQHYIAATLEKRVIFPQQTGKLQITPYEINVTLYNSFGFPYMQKKAKSNSLTINVKPLPTKGKPADFSGAVGKFNFSVKVDKKQVNIDEPITIKLSIQGTGNFGLFDMPQPQVPNSFEALEPKEIPQYKATELGMQGRLTKEYIYIPRSTGQFVIPPIRFAYFDPQTEKYHIIQSDTIKLTVIGSNTDTTQIYSSYKSDVKQLGNDIIYIETEKFNLRPKGKYFAGSTLHYLSYLILALLFATIALLERKKIKESSDIRKLRAKQAGKVSSRRLRLARKYLKADKKEKFYDAIRTALWGYLGDKLGIDPVNLTREKAREELKKRNVPQELIDQFISIIDNSEFAIYAPTQANVSMEQIYQQAKTLIDKLENLI